MPNAFLINYRKSRGNADGDPSIYYEDFLDILKHLNGDLLMILDACYAGTANYKYDLMLKKFEILVASSHDELTPRSSFTPSLVRHMNALLDKNKDGFPVSQLHHELDWDSNLRFKPRWLVTHVRDYGKIYLRPIKPPSQPARADGLPPAVVYLRLTLGCVPDELVIRNLAIRMRGLPHTKAVAIHSLYSPKEHIKRLAKVATITKVIGLLENSHTSESPKVEEIPISSSPNESELEGHNEPVEKLSMVPGTVTPMDTASAPPEFANNTPTVNLTGPDGLLQANLLLTQELERQEEASERQSHRDIDRLSEDGTVTGEEPKEAMRDKCSASHACHCSSKPGASSAVSLSLEKFLMDLNLLGASHSLIVRATCENCQKVKTLVTIDHLPDDLLQQTTIKQTLLILVYISTLWLRVLYYVFVNIAELWRNADNTQGS
jgi:hypothetical protein